MVKAHDKIMSVNLSIKSVFLASFLIFTFLFSSFLVTAQPPFQQGDFIEGLHLEVPVIEYIKAGENFTFHVHAYNGTTGEIIPSTDLNCSIHIYSNQNNGQHLVETDMSPCILNEIDMVYNVSGDLLVPGLYATVISCESNGAGGFFEYGFDVTSNAEPIDKTLDFNKSITLLIVLTAIAFILFIIYLYNKDEYYLPIIAGILFILSGVFSFTALDGMFDKLIVDSIGIILIGLGLINLGESIWRFFPDD